MALDMATRLNKDLAKATGDIGITVTWSADSQDYAAIVADDGLGVELDTAGIEDEVTISFLFRTALFSGAVPAAGETLTYNGETYRILRAQKEFSGKALIAHCAGNTK